MYKSCTEIYRSNLKKLGEAMVSLLNGEEMDEMQILLIKQATEKQKVLALQIMASTTLKGDNYTNYCINIKKILSK